MVMERFLKGRLRHDLSAAEKRALEGVVADTMVLAPRETLVSRGDRLDNSYYLIEGVMLRHLEDQRGDRQLVEVNIAGDFVDLHGYAMKRLDHSVQSLTRTVLAKVPHAALSQVIAVHPHLGRAMWFSTLLDAAMHREWIFRLGRLNAEGRIAHLLVELIERLRLVGLYDADRDFPVPLLQRDYAEACGISAVHANRSFRTLKERGMVVMEGEGRLRILDEVGLRKLCDFDGAYLYGEGSLALDGLTDAPC
ncbi:Crp/Fnr family transcriptional regulator [Pelagerythrobacter sp.]|uniref:Crp/Fnr family transcriptional regulator n=1 Tax=Pelagerythrobacter sp. TaxID=2800702 RepID=UPI0035B3CE24